VKKNGEKNMSLTFGSLFAGIGGFDLGLERAGMICKWQVEWNQFCQEVLKKHWPHIPKYGDITKLRGDELETVDIVCGGFPCQPFSIAGKRRGKADNRYLWPEMLRIIKELRPRWVIGENVTGIINMALDTVLSDLESEDYETATLIIPACAVGAPHRRDRIWIVAYHPGNAQQKKSEDNNWRTSEIPVQGRFGTGTSFRSRIRDFTEGITITRRIACEIPQNMADTTIERLEGEQQQEFERARVRPVNNDERATQSGLGRMSNGLSSWLDCYRWPTSLGREQYEWEPPQLIRDKVPNHRKRLQSLGNAVVPQVVEAIGRAIIEIENTF